MAMHTPNTAKVRRSLLSIVFQLFGISGCGPTPVCTGKLAAAMASLWDYLCNTILCRHFLRKFLPALDNLTPEEQYSLLANKKRKSLNLEFLFEALCLLRLFRPNSFPAFRGRRFPPCLNNSHNLSGR